MTLRPLPEAKHNLRTAIKELYDALHVAKDNKVREHHSNAHDEVLVLKLQMEALDDAVQALRTAGVI